MESKTEQINETEKVSETITFSKTVPVGIEKGDCISCPYKTNTTSGICPTYTIYGWCRQTMGENPPDIQEPKSFYSEAMKWVDSTPNSYYPIRILRAYLDYTETKTNPPELGNLMNELQHSRNLILEKAIKILEEHREELRAYVEEPLYENLAMLEEVNELQIKVSELKDKVDSLINNNASIQV